MSVEREIKLSLPSAHVDAARALLTELAGRDGRTITLVNIYFDTPERTLARAKSALRLRRTPDGWLQTLKFGGGAQQGVHSRHEWEMAVAGEAFEFDALLTACNDPAAVAALREAAPRVEPLFRTDFTRTLWPLDWHGTAIEAALDVGEVSAVVEGETRRVPIREIELELKDPSGAAAEAALDAVAAIVKTRLPGVAPDDVSKAERGYRLRDAR
jgi:inorganic triphosphatase YgiF